MASCSPICIPLISLSCLLDPLNTYSTLLKRSGESRGPCLLPGLNGIASRFSLLDDFGYGFVICNLILLKYASPVPYSLKDFYHEVM